MKSMNKILTLCLTAFVFFIEPASAQLLKKITSPGKSADSSTASGTKKSIKDLISGAKSGGLSTDEIAKGLKEALTVGAEQSGKKLAALDGYFGNAAIKVVDAGRSKSR